jgi:hypothetical protein
MRPVLEEGKRLRCRKKVLLGLQHAFVIRETLEMLLHAPGGRVRMFLTF